MFCIHCGKSIVEDSKFCYYCGKGIAVREMPQQEIIEEEIIKKANPRQEKITFQSNKFYLPRNILLWMLIGIGIGLGIGIILNIDLLEKAYNIARDPILQDYQGLPTIAYIIEQILEEFFYSIGVWLKIGVAVGAVASVIFYNYLRRDLLEKQLMKKRLILESRPQTIKEYIIWVIVGYLLYISMTFIMPVGQVAVIMIMALTGGSLPALIVIAIDGMQHLLSIKYGDGTYLQYIFLVRYITYLPLWYIIVERGLLGVLAIYCGFLGRKKDLNLAKGNLHLKNIGYIGIGALSYYIASYIKIWFFITSNHYKWLDAGVLNAIKFILKNSIQAALIAGIIIFLITKWNSWQHHMKE